MTEAEIFKLCDTVRETGFSIHPYLRHGHLEKIYENSLVNRLRKQGIKVETQQELSVFDEDGTLLGKMVVDLLVEDELIIELKACSTLTSEHVAQLLGYLRASIEHGLLVNFGSPKFEIKKYALSRIS
jgi:GxxExxY protein